MPLPHLHKGVLVGGRYALLRRLGEGVSADVWLAEDEERHKVALKLAPQAMGKALRREATALKAVGDHPNVVGCLGFMSTVQVSSGVPLACLVLRYVPGYTLARQLASGPLPLHRALQIADSACRALSAVHAAGVLHLDIKPANLIVGYRHTVLLDFGLAVRNGNVPETNARWRGTPLYMAPEISLPSSMQNGDARADLYSLGITLYEMLTGETPFPRSLGCSKVLRAHREDVPDAPSDRCPGLPTAVDSLVLRALAKDPAARFQSAEDMRTALVTLARSMPTVAVLSAA